MKKKSLKYLFMVFLTVFLSACISDNPGGRESPSVGASDFSSDAARIAVILPLEENSDDPMSSEIMIGLNRLAREFGGTIVGLREKVDFGDAVEFRVFSTHLRESNESNDIITGELRELGLDGYDLVIGAGYSYPVPFSEINRDYAEQHFVIIDSSGSLEGTDNITEIKMSVYGASFIAGAVAAERFKGQSLGVIGGIDLPLIREEFIDGYVAGIEYMDSIMGSHTEILLDFAGSFGDPETGYRKASGMFEAGVACIYQVAGLSGIGVLDAAGETGKWAIGVDTDQGLERALAGLPYEHILTSAVKNWDNAVYLVCREYLLSGFIPPGVQKVGLEESCSGVAVNPYNSPILGEQLNTIKKLENDLRTGNISEIPPRMKDSGGEATWMSLDSSDNSRIMVITVNDPVLSEGIPSSYGPILQEALSGEMHETGRFQVIDSEQVERLLSEISFSLEGISEENTELEVGRLIAAEAIVFVNLSELGERLNLDCKLVDVETGLLITSVREVYPDFENVLVNLNHMVRQMEN